MAKQTENQPGNMDTGDGDITSGDGAVARGQSARAVGRDGVMIDGNLNGNIYKGLNADELVGALKKAFPKDDTHPEQIQILSNQFSDLQAAHEELVNKVQSSEEVLEQVQQYLKSIQSGSSQVSSAHERDQLRANLRYWIGYVYEKTKEYPNVDLLPSITHHQKDRRLLFFLVGGASLLLFLFILGYFSFNFGDNKLGQIDPSIGTFIAQTQTATQWTPAPIVSNQAMIVNALNAELQRQADPIEEMLDAKFSVMDIGFDQDGYPLAATTMSVQVKCEWVTTPSCTTERALIAFATAFKGLKTDVRKKIIEQIPETVLVIQIRAFDHMSEIGIVEVSWDVLLAFADGDITAGQLAARTIRFIIPDLTLAPSLTSTSTPTPILTSTP